MNSPTGSGRTQQSRLLMLYTELAPYTLACLNALVDNHPVDVDLVRWTVNKEAPFELDFHPHITVHERQAISDEGLAELALDRSPALVITSGWVDKGYLKACRALRKKGATTVMILDTAWRGDWRQWANVLAARLWRSRTFSHAWVTGEAQAEYARRLGFGAERIRKGFYSADTAPLLAFGEELLAERKAAWPHRFLHIARYIPTKGHQLLCDAFAELVTEGTAGDWELWLVGTGELQQEVMRSASGAHPRIRHLGFKQAGELRDVMRPCGVFVLPSTYEPWGVVVHESACAGLPLILSSAVGAAERFLKDGINGYRFSSGDKEALKSVMRSVVQRSDDELREMGSHSAELGRAWSPMEWAHTAAELLNTRLP